MVAASRIGLSNGLTYYVLTPLNEILKGMEKVRKGKFNILPII